MVHKYDFLVIGSGLAGMSFALKVAHQGRVALICKAGLEEDNTYYAQGGIASVTNLAADNFDKHIEDTMIAGDYISDLAAVEKVVKGGPAQIEELIRWGVDFDKNEQGTISTEERVLITQSMKEVNQIMGAYVGIVRSNTRLKRAWNRLGILYEETEALFKRSKATRELCELRNMINVGYLITRQAMERKESRGLHYTIDYPKSKLEQS